MIPLYDSEKSGTIPVVTIALIIINLIVFVFEAMLDEQSLNMLINNFGLIPAHITVTGLFCSMFLHGGWMHVLGNMLYLWIFGDNVEDKLGHGWFLVFYLLCGCIAGLSFCGIEGASTTPLVGASGAIAGVLGAYVLLCPHSRIVTLIFWIVPIILVPAWIYLGLWFVLQFLYGFMEMGVVSSGTAWWAHVGGFIAGMLFVWVFIKNKSSRQNY